MTRTDRSMIALFLAVPLFLLAVPALAETNAQFAMPGVRAPDDSDVNGFRASFLYGEVDSMRGFDLGMASVAKASSFNGFAFVFGASWITSDSQGVVASMANYHEGAATGLLFGILNRVDSMDNGANLGLVNYTEGYSMVDAAALAISQRSKVQIGMVNVTEEIETIQLGLVCVAKNGMFPAMILFNLPEN